MKSFGCVALALMSLTGAASAADVPARSAAPPAFAVVPAFTWTGFYIGVHAGYAWMETDTVLADVYGIVLETDVRNETLASRIGRERDGAIGGIQAGYNVQMGMFVAGVEADASWSEGEARATYSALDLYAFAGAMTHSTFRSEVEALGTIRARAGVAIDRALFYATGGLAVGEVTDAFAVKVGPYSGSWTNRSTEWGWALGAGIEYALTNNLSAKLEYLHFDLGDRVIRYMDPPWFQDQYIDYKYKTNGDIVRAGVNFRF